ncbi:EAL domain-containing protein [Sphingosinicellaceae bacterium]|nr:EAL domain-containing protein [Sphingosinicellaceae bacterium]
MRGAKTPRPPRRLVKPAPDKRPLTAARLAAIGRYQILDTAPEADFDDIALLAATVCRTPFAAISFVADDRQWFKAEVGLGIAGTPIGHSFCAHAIEQDDVLVVVDAREHPLFADNPLVTKGPALRFYAGVPLRSSDGTPIATLCIMDREPRPNGLTETEKTTLKVLAKQIEMQLELRRSVIEHGRHAAQQAEAAEHLRRATELDLLTGLPNRRLFHSRLTAAVDAAACEGNPMALLLIDIDNFKQLNDTLGFEAGDALLRAFGERLSSVVDANDTVARQGGDEFSIILANAGTDRDLSQFLKRLLTLLRTPLPLDNRNLDLRATVGIAVYPADAENNERLFYCADLALATAKAEGRDRILRFRPDMAAELERVEAMVRLSHHVLDEDLVTPFYQPKMDLLNGSVAGFEALLRWQTPSGRVMLPSTIEAAFSDPELSVAVGTRMLKRALADMRNWLETGVDFGSIAINSSIGDFAADDYAERVLGALADFGVAPYLLQVEVTEGVFLGRGSSYVERALACLRASGVRVALDDFGTGFASLTHLKQFEIDILKIDRAFIAGLGTNRDDAAIVRAVILLGQHLGIEVVAEGVETIRQSDYLKSAGCRFAQGFLFSQALPAIEVPDVITELESLYMGKVLPQESLVYTN